ncbi:ead/Ea22-like family protein [Enterobacter cloacae]|uniref:ead/Ea22-like family protein n=1 Tax=Enterobacter cloacae TaxID=550 RepID=UPI00292F7CE6|nr:ead/Ea22-like family protein [Enterobacter cloacae]
MSNIDKRALREAAERAGQNDWEYVYTSDLSAPGRGYITVGGAEAIYCLNKAAGGVKQSENVLRYIAAASPETMLALLDELEAAGRRIAELEAREVQLPPKAQDNLASCLDGYEKWLIATTFRDTWNACLAEVVRVNAAAGKGEAS